MIKHIRIQNFRSLHDVSVDLDPLTVLIGRSGTGKSNFVRAIRFLRDVLSNPGQGPGSATPAETIPPATNPQGQLGYHVRLQVPGFGEELEYAVTFAAGAGFRAAFVPAEEWLRSGTTTVFHQSGMKWDVEPNLIPRVKPGPLQLGSLTGLRPATVAHVALTTGIGCYDFPGAVLQSPVAGNGRPSGYADGGTNYLPTTEAILNNLERLGDWEEVAGALKTLNKSVRGIDLRLPERNRIEVGHAVGDKLILLDVAQESEGFRRFFAHLLALYQTPPKQTVIFEHPESGIHPGALATLFEEFEDYNRKGRGQVIVTTHSPQLLDHFKAENIRVVDIENGVTTIGPLAPEQAEPVREKLLFPGELLTVDPARLPGQLAEVPG